jgi:acetyl-CoA acetyltransferase
MTIYVAGVGMTRFGRHPDETVRSLASAAALEAMADAGCSPAMVDAIFFGNAGQGAMEGQHSIRGELALKDIPFRPVPIVNTENACASAATAFYLAVAHVKAGLADVALAVGAEKMLGPDKARSAAIFDGSWDVHDVPRSTAALLALGEGVETPAEFKDTGPHSVFMDVYQGFTKFHMREFGTTVRQLAAVSSKNHAHSVDNPRSQYRQAYSVDEVLAARMIAWPLTLPMCSPVSDGAAAAVVCSPAALARLSRSSAVQVRASVLAAGGRRKPQDYTLDSAHLMAKKAYESASIGPDEVSLAEVHDATAFGEIQQAENLMLCGFGEGGPLAESGATRIGGRIPINPSGGLESKGHPIGATGLGQIFELVTQLRGEAGNRQVEGARIAIAENGGGVIGVEAAAVAVTILGV